MDPKNFVEDFVSPDDWWFWLLLPITGPLWLLGELLDMFF